MDRPAPAADDLRMLLVEVLGAWFLLALLAVAGCALLLAGADLVDGPRRAAGTPGS